MTTPAEKTVPELLLCPICGKLPDKPVDATRLMGVWRIIHRCPVMGFMETSAADVATATSRWNTRTPIPSSAVVLPREVVERARGLLDQIANHDWMCSDFQSAEKFQRIAIEVRALLPSTGAGVGE